MLGSMGALAAALLVAAAPGAASKAPASRAPMPKAQAPGPGLTVVPLNGGAASAGLPGQPQQMDADTLGAMAPSLISLALIRMLAEHPAAAQSQAEAMAQAVMAGEGWATPTAAGGAFYAVADFPVPSEVAMLELPLKCPTPMPDAGPGAPVVACHLVAVHGLAGLEVTSTAQGRVTDIFRVVAAGGRFYELIWRGGAPSATGTAAGRRFLESLQAR